MHYFDLMIAGFIGLLTLLVAEYGYRRQWWRGEGARKLVHITVGVQAAVWPLYLDWFEIRLISIVLTIGFIVCMQLRLFQSIGTVKRLSYGEVLFTLMIGALTLVTDSAATYAAAMLHLSVADGLAALIGQRFGRGNRYKVFGHTKSIAGSGAFLLTSLIILTAYSFIAPPGLAWWAVLGGAITATILENIGTFGSDNILVPAFIIAMLQYL